AIAVERFELEEGHEVGADGRGLDRIHGGFQLEYEVANELPQPADRFLALLHHGAFDIGKRPPRKALESRPASLLGRLAGEGLRELPDILPTLPERREGDLGRRAV